MQTKQHFVSPNLSRSAHLDSTRPNPCILLNFLTWQNPTRPVGRVKDRATLVLPDAENRTTDRRNSHR